jgi:hypothetical protein
MRMPADKSTDYRLNPTPVVDPCMIQAVLTNHTGKGGREAFPVVTPVTFRDLTMVLTFANGVRSAIPLYDSERRRRNDLAVECFYVHSAAFPVRHAEHGPLVRVLMRGYFSVTMLQIRTTTASDPLLVTVARDFKIELKHPSTDTYVAIRAESANGQIISLGTLSMIEPREVAAPPVRAGVGDELHDPAAC